MTKLAIVFSLIFSFQAFAASTSAQNIKIELENVSIEAALDALQAQGAYRFVYKKETLPQETKVSINVENASLSTVMNKILQNTSLSYQVINNTLVVIVPGEIVRQRTISGKVTDQDGVPLAGVSIIQKGTTNGTASNENGTFSLTVASDNAVLVFSSLGYISKEVSVSNNNNNMVVILEKLDAEMDQVVVVGYGTQKKANMTGAVSTINFDKQSMSSRAISNVSSAMAGLAPGIMVRQSNGLPSANNDAELSVRGVGSLNISSAPLVIVDGQVADINSVSPNDVASVSVLKDAASASIYGSRASNGVILITTKTGKGMNGKVAFNYSNYVGWKKPTLLPDWAYNTVDHMRLINMTLENSGSAPWYSEEDIAEWTEGIVKDPITYPSTNWWDAIIKRNIIQNHNISARGGSDKVNFYTSMDYYKDDGLIPNTAFQRLNFRNNLSYKVNDWLRLGNNIAYVSHRSDPVQIDDIFQWFRASSPSILPRHPDGRYGSPQLKNEISNNNPMQSVTEERGETKGNRFQGKIFGVITPLKGLSVTGSYFADIFQQQVWGGSEPTDLWNFKTGEKTNDASGNTRVLRNNFQKNQREIIDLYADYVKAFGRHHGHILAGYNQEYFKKDSFAGARRDLLSYETPVLNAATGEITNLTGSANDYALRSFFGRLNYDFDGKYLFEANLRYDGSSRFAPEHRWGLFPSASIGWMISKENFFEPLNGVFTNFKLRASYGKLGNNGIGNYAWQNFYSVVRYPFNEQPVSALNYRSFGNNRITWEATTATNVGIDTRLFDRIDLELEYYNKSTKSILANLPIPATNGGISAPLVNSAEVRNYGLEAKATYAQRLGKLNIYSSVNIAYNKNRIVSYKGDFIEPHGQNAAAWTERYPIGVFWVREVDHIIQSQKEVDDLVAQGYTFSPATPGAGDFLYKDNNGDKKINDDDRVLKGSPIPEYTYGGNITLEYAGIDFSVYFDGVGKWDRYLSSSVYMLTHNIGNFIFPTSYLNMWTPENTNTTIPKVYSGSQVNNQVSDFYLHKADYLKIRSLQLGYSLPNGVIKSLGITKFRLFANLENYFTRTDWPNLDPEMTRSTNDDASYPLGKVASVGLQVSF